MIDKNGLHQANQRVCKPMISIVTATLNCANLLETAIQSIIQQDYPELEYVVIDGGSTDGTVDLIRRYEADIDAWVSEPDRGISDAFNKGISLCTGDIIGIVSADDYLLPQSLVRIAEAYCGHPEADVFYGNAVFVEPFNQRQFVVRPDVGLRTIWRRQSLKHAATFVTHRAYDRFGGFDSNYKLAMDYELILRFYTRGAKFIYLDWPLAAFRTGGISARHTYQTIREVRDISLRYGFSPMKAYPIYWLKLARLTAKHGLLRVGGIHLLNLYRSISARFSPYTP